MPIGFPKLYIAALSDVQIGPEIDRIVGNFDTDPELRYKVLSVAQCGVYEPLSPEGVEESFGGIRLNDFVGPVFFRENVMGYLELLELIVGRLNGKDDGSPTIMTLDNASLVAGIENHRGEWIRADQLRQAVEVLIKALKGSAYCFNVQLLAIWMLSALRLSKRLYFCEDIDRQEIIQQATAIEDLAYSRGCQNTESVVAKAHQKIADLRSASSEIKQLFLVTGEQFRRFGLLRMDISDDTSVFDWPEVEGDIQIVNPWTVSKGGIFVPK